MTNEIQAVLAELKGALPGFDEKFEKIQKRIDEIESKRSNPGNGWQAAAEDGIDSFVKQFQESKKDFERTGRLVIKTPSLLQTKATVTSTGLFVPDAPDGVNGAGRNPYSLRNIFRSTDAGSGSVFGVRSTVESTSPASQSSEGATKAESSYTLTGTTVSIPTIATFVNVSRQAMEDVIGLGEFLRSTLLWGLRREAERQMLLGDGTNAVMEGISSTAQAFDSTILPPASGYKIADLLAAAACQLREDGYMANFFVVHPRSWLRAILTKATDGQYIVGGPQSSVSEQMWTMRAVVSDQIPSTHFIVGDSSAALVRPRMDATIDISDSHGTNFTANVLTVRAEERLVLQKLRPDAFVYGSTTTSPIS